MLLAHLFLASLLLAETPVAGSVCLRISGDQQAVDFPVRIGEQARLSFRHSIYGSEVEEYFRIAGNGLQPTRLRYSEARLVEFYGHERARLDRGWWVVDSVQPVIPYLDLRASRDSSFRIAVGSDSTPFAETAISGARVRLTPIPCSKEIDGR